MIFESLAPAETSSRVHAVRFLQKRYVHEKVQKRVPNGSKNDQQMEPKGPLWALLGLTLVILEGFETRPFLIDF